MRAIVNLTGRVNKAAGWSAREINLEKAEATIEDVLRTVKMKDGSTLFDLIGEDNGIKSGFAIIVSGHLYHGSADTKTAVKQDDQFHIMDFPVVFGDIVLDV